MYIPDKRARRDLKRWAEQIFELMQYQPDDWDPLERAAIQLEKQNSRFRQHEHVLAMAVPVFLSYLSERPYLRYPLERYESLLTMMSRLYSRPLMLFPVVRLASEVDDPAELMEKALQKPFDGAWRLHNADAVAPALGRQRFVLTRAGSTEEAALHSVDDLHQQAREDLAAWSSEVSALAALPPSRWEAVIEAVCLLERKNPRFKQRDLVMTLAIEALLSNLELRQEVRHSPPDYVTLIDRFSWQFAQPLIFLYVLDLMLRRREDPAFLLERADILPFEPAWLTESMSVIQ